MTAAASSPRRYGSRHAFVVGIAAGTALLVLPSCGGSAAVQVEHTTPPSTPHAGFSVSFVPNGLSDGHLKALRAALDSVSEAFNAPTFRKWVVERKVWLTRATLCGDDVEEAVVSGEEVLRTVLDASFGPVAFRDGAICGSTIASTGICPASIKIESDRYEQPTQLANTVAHELTHLVADATDACAYRYTDDDHDDCTERALVSYRLGQMVECFHRDPERDKSKFDACMSDSVADLGKMQVAGRTCLERINAISRSCMQ